jgi:regulatory protein
MGVLGVRAGGSRKAYFMTTHDKTDRDYEPTYSTAVRLLGRRAHSRKELARKLRQRGYLDAVIEKVLQNCEAHHYIDDAAACDSYCRELIRKGAGPRMIRQRLAGRGIQKSLIESVLETRYPQDVVRATARAVATRKRDQLAARLLQKGAINARLARFLTQRGFPMDIIHAIIEEHSGDELS